eukprot:1670858-Pyramimonas_sp.AAC.1
MAVDSQAVSDEEFLSAYCESFETWFQDQGWSGISVGCTNGSQDLARVLLGGQRRQLEPPVFQGWP